MQRTSWRAALAVLAALLLTATACVEQAQLPDDCDAPTVARTATLAGDHLNPEAIDVCRGQQVTLEVVTQQDGVLHLHGYEQEAPATELHAGDRLEFTFEASRAGQFVIEVHPPEGEELEVGIFTVHER